MGGAGVAILTYLISREEGWEKLKSKYFLRNGERMKKVANDGCSFGS